VGGWSGDGHRTAPVIAAGDSFVARMVPPRAGTFIYHSHVDEARHLASGLYGALVVLDSAAKWNPARDHILIFSQAGTDDSAAVVANGGRSPAIGPLRPGVSHRIRIINITAGDLVTGELLDGDSITTWRRVAKDGADLPANLAHREPARFVMGAGETLDVELTPTSPKLRFRIKSFNDFDVPIPVGRPVTARPSERRQ
jgi:FtsP/CotA-like multicopper oxidase with cupredoxin domain